MNTDGSGWHICVVDYNIIALNKAGEAIKPPVEPPGRAPEGESYVK